MNILLTAATEMELQGLDATVRNSVHSVQLAAHGVGQLMGTYQLLALCQKPPDLMIQIGIAGSYQSALRIGATVVVSSETLGDSGAEDHNDLITLTELGLLNAETFPFQQGALVNPHADLFPSHLPKVKSLTVSLAGGSSATVERRRKKFNPDIESMEGAVLHYVGLMKQIPFLQFRGISNAVEPRNRAGWQIQDAIASCHREVLHFIQQLP